MPLKIQMGKMKTELEMQKAGGEWREWKIPETSADSRSLGSPLDIDTAG